MIVRAATCLVALALAGCNLPTSGDKNRCFTQRDCLDGYVCIDQRCVTPSVGGNGGAGGSGGGGGGGNGNNVTIPDMSIAGDMTPPCHGTVVDGGACLPGTWTRRADMPTPRERLALVAVPDGRIFALGGISQSNGTLATVEVYTPSADSWTTVAPMLNQRYGFGAAFGSDGRIYVFGGPYDNGTGGNSDGVSRLVEAYDLGNDKWIAAPMLQRPHSDVPAIAAADGYLYVVGGFDYTTSTLGSYEAWKPGLMGWASSGFTMTTPRSSHALALASDGRLFALGGNDRNGDKLAAVEWFMPGKPGWMTAAPMPTTRAWLAAATGSDGTIYAIGGNGFNAGGAPALSTVEAYSPTANSWQTVAPLPTPRWALGAVAGKDGKIYAIGGVTQSGVGTGGDAPTVEVFTP